MIDHPTDISKDCHQTSQIFAQIAVVLTRCLELDGTCMTSTSSIGTEWTTEWAPFLRLAVSVLTKLNWRDPVALNKCFDSSTDYQIDVFGNVFFNYRTIESRTCNKKATHIPVSILIISCLDSHNLSTNWVVTAEDILSVVRFAGSACGHFPVYASNMKPSVWWNNEVKSSKQ